LWLIIYWKNKILFKKEVHNVSIEVKAPMVGKVLHLRCEVGQSLNEDDEMFILEAMKMEIPIGSPGAGKVKEIKVAAGQAVETDQLLAILE